MGNSFEHQVPLSDEAVAVRVAELVDGVMQQLLAVWDKLEPVALGGSGMSMASAALQVSSDANSGACRRCFLCLLFSL